MNKKSEYTNYMFQNQELLEVRVARKVHGMEKAEAISLIQRNDLVPRVLQEDKQFYPRTKDYISHRINLYIRKGRIFSSEIG